MKDILFAFQDSEITADQLSGEGNKGVLIVVRVKETNEKTLTDLLAAIELDAQKDIIKLTVSDAQQVSLNSFLIEQNIFKVVSFDFTSKELGLNINHAFYHRYQIGDRIFILSESISELNKEKDKKIALWKSLKSTFLN